VKQKKHDVLSDSGFACHAQKQHTRREGRDLRFKEAQQKDEITKSERISGHLGEVKGVKGLRNKK